MISYPNVKVNLGLSVLRKRPDGYHDLETLFVPWFGFHDTLEIITGDDYSRISARLFGNYGVTGQVADGGIAPENRATLGIVRGGTLQGGVGAADVLRDNTAAAAESLRQAIREDGKVMITIARKEGVDWDPLKDLTVKAYGLLDADFNLPPVKIFLEKTSPVGAGLGGGSADAAFALRMLSEIFNLGLDDATLASYAARLGSDCAFFIYNRPMLGTGRGEILEPYDLDGIDFSAKQEDTKALYDLSIVIPEGVAVSTADAYRGIEPREVSQLCRTPLLDALSKPVEQWRDCLVNDFETTVFAKYPEIAAAKRSLYDQGAVYAAMSGSGSSVFALFPR
ncbi:MAG: hypothetical protein Q4G10_00075 [Bacteroidia bacterium]|nr:hypothetical protein [Bacteroidia bacterium]